MIIPYKKIELEIYQPLGDWDTHSVARIEYHGRCKMLYPLTFVFIGDY